MRTSVSNVGVGEGLPGDGNGYGRKLKKGKRKGNIGQGHDIREREMGGSK